MLQYWLWLATRQGLAPSGAAQIARYFPTPEAAYFASAEDYRQISGLRDFRPLLDKDLTLPQRILSDCYEKGISLLTYQDAAYPQRLKSLYDPPVVLYCRGALPDLNRPAMAVVGTRKATPYGILHGKRFGYALSRCGCLVVSGGALGVDAAAMEGALLGGSPVIGVLGCGVDLLYPKANQRLLEDVLAYGCLLSEYPPGTPVRREYFPARNRIVSGLSLGVLVVEAPDRSGSMITARDALEQGRDVFTIPANLGAAACAGNLQLLRDGAILARDVWDILQEYEAVYPELSCGRDCPALDGMDQQVLTREAPAVSPPPKKQTRDSAALLEGLSPVERQIVTLLLDGPMLLDDILDSVDLAPGQLMATLTVLEVKQRIQRSAAGEYALAE